MSTVKRTTELEAINTMLSCINESPINDLDVTGLVDVDTAKSVLSEVSRDVQGRGWHFNSETDYPLIREASGKIAYPSNAFKIDTTERFREGYDVAQRGNFLYNKKTRSFLFDTDLEVDIVFIFTFEEIPEAARRFIMIRASRIFQARQQGSDAQFKFSAQEELDAMTSLKDYEGETGDYNFLSDSASVATLWSR